jgi:NitT/TauT family transport system ATP-binding protein
MELLHIEDERRKTVVFVTPHIGEAVLLSGVIVVMTARPGRIAGTFNIDVPRPRSRETLTSPVYFDHITPAREIFG